MLLYYCLKSYPSTDSPRSNYCLSSARHDFRRSCFAIAKTRMIQKGGWKTIGTLVQQNMVNQSLVAFLNYRFNLNEMVMKSVVHLLFVVMLISFVLGCSNVTMIYEFETKKKKKPRVKSSHKFTVALRPSQ